MLPEYFRVDVHHPLKWGHMVWDFCKSVSRWTCQNWLFSPNQNQIPPTRHANNRLTWKMQIICSDLFFINSNRNHVKMEHKIHSRSTVMKQFFLSTWYLHHIFSLLSFTRKWMRNFSSKESHCGFRNLTFRANNCPKKGILYYHFCRPKRFRLGYKCCWFLNNSMRRSTSNPRTSYQSIVVHWQSS